MKQVYWGNKIIQRVAPDNITGGYGGWLKTSRGWETWSMDSDFPFTDLNTIYVYHSKYCIDNDHFYYLIEEIDETEYNRLSSSISVTGCSGPSRPFDATKPFTKPSDVMGVTGPILIDVMCGGGSGSGKSSSSKYVGYSGASGPLLVTPPNNDEEFRHQILQHLNKYVKEYDLPISSDGQAINQEAIRQITREEIKSVISNLVKGK